MATIAKELHDGLVTVIDKLNTMVAVLQKIEAEQQDCLYKLDVMAGIKLADAKPPPTPLLSLLPTPSLASTNLVQSLLEMMDTMPMLHPDLQSIVDEQQPMSMDVLPAFHPDLQQVVDKQQATSAAAPQPVVQSELLLPPALPLFASTAAATYGPPPRPTPLPTPPTAGTTTFSGIENLPPPSCAPKAAILCTVSIPASSPTLGFVAATSSYKPVGTRVWRDVPRRCLDHKEGLLSIYRNHEVCNVFNCQE
jgi:hypothetical protein